MLTTSKIELALEIAEELVQLLEHANEELERITKNEKRCLV
jgi:hypothetical protein